MPIQHRAMIGVMHAAGRVVGVAIRFFISGEGFKR